MESFITEVPYKCNGKKVRFYNDRMELNSQTLRYDEIATLVTSADPAATVHTYVGIPVGRSFSGGFRIKMNNGKSYVINLASMSVFGIPFIRNPRKCEKLYLPLFHAFYSIVAKSMAQNYIDKINRGSSVEVSGFTIDSSKAVANKTSKKETVINRENYRDCVITSCYGVAVYDKQGNELWNSSLRSCKNFLLLPHIFSAIFC